MKASTKVKQAALYKLVDYLVKDPEKGIDTIMDRLEPLIPKSLYSSQRNAFRVAIEEKNNWYRLIMKLFKLNPEVASQLIETFVVDANLLAWSTQEENRDKYQCNIPWAILLDPTTACNLSCTGCWAAEYGHHMNLTYDDIDSIIRQGKELGTHMYIYTGGEPLMRKKDVIRICEEHPDCAFLSFTNATLIDEDFCKEMVRVKNFVPAISVEGFKEATDARRGEGVFDQIDHAMSLLREYGLPFGVSCCHTSENHKSLCTEEFFDWMIDKGVLFCWVFSYMPVGVGSPTDLMVYPEQREELYHLIRDMRKTKEILTMDFWNDGEYVGGCIAGGRRYLHINAAGDVEPCVFAHYSNANIHDVSLLDALRQPLFMEYYNNQPFNKNLLRPCPMLDNAFVLEDMVKASGAHSTELVEKEDVHDLCAKCAPRAEAWQPVADKLWNNPDDERYPYRQKKYVGMAETDIHKFERREEKKAQAAG